MSRAGPPGPLSVVTAPCLLSERLTLTKFLSVSLDSDAKGQEKAVARVKKTLKEFHILDVQVQAKRVGI